MCPDHCAAKSPESLHAKLKDLTEMYTTAMEVHKKAGMHASPSAMLRVGMIRQIWRSIAPQHAVASALGQHLSLLSATAASISTSVRGEAGCWHCCFSTSHQSVHSYMAEEHTAKRKKLDVAAAAPAELDANEVIKFRLLDPYSNATELTEQASFAPEMCHQFFGDDEVRPQLQVDSHLRLKQFMQLDARGQPAARLVPSEL